MARNLKAATTDDVSAIKLALRDARSARANLRRAGAHQAARYQARAIKSIEGALRHAYRRARIEGRQSSTPRAAEFADSLFDTLTGRNAK